MDDFVKNQLTLIGCENLIPLFRDKGYNEEAHRKLTNRKLIQLLPEGDDDDGELAIKIMCSIRRLNNPDNDSCNSTGLLFPPPSVIVKTERVERVQDLVANPAPDCNEVEIVNVTIRGPSAFTRVVEIKQELAEGSSASDSTDKLTASTSTMPRSNDRCSRPVIVEKLDIPDLNIEELDPSGDEDAEEEAVIDFATTEAVATGNANGSRGNVCSASDHGRQNGSRRNLRPRKRMLPEDDNLIVQRQERVKPSWEEEISWQNFIQLHFGQDPSRLSITRLKSRCGTSLEFKLSTITQIGDVLRLIETYSDDLCEVKGLTLAQLEEDYCEISNIQIHRLADFPERFLNQLTSLTFSVRFPENTDYCILSFRLS